MKEYKILYLNSSTDYKIEDRKGMHYTIEEARKLFDGGYVKDYNIAFDRLVAFGWDLERVKKFYQPGPWNLEDKE